MKLGLALLCGLVGLSVANGMVASAAQPMLTQEIKIIDCTNTATNNGLDVTTNTDCDGVISPSVNSLITDDRTPLITGAFDAATMRQMRVLFLGRWYVLGQDGELTVSGNQWRLDLSHLLPPLQPGAYNVTVEVITTHQQLLRSSLAVRITASTQSSNDPNGNNNEHNDGTLVPTGENLFLTALFSACLIGAGVVLLVAKQR